MSRFVSCSKGWISVGLVVLLLSGCQVSNPSKNPKKSVQVRTQLAAEYIRSGDLDAAKRTLDQALHVDSHDSMANMMMGVLLQQEGSPANMERAETYFKRSISEDNQNAQARNNYGTYLYQLKRYNDALEQFKIAGSSLGYEQRYRSYENMGRIYVALNDQAKAQSAFLQALQINQNADISMLELAEIYYLQQKIPTATQMYENYVRTVGHTNQNARALWIGIRVARANGDRIGMQALVNQLRALFPDSLEYTRYLQLQDTTEVVWK